MESTDFQKTAQDLEKRGDKKKKGSFFGNMMKGKQDRKDEAGDLYQQAANCYKLAKDNQSAFRCYEKCIQCEETEVEAAKHYKEAALCVKEMDSEKYIQLSQKAIDLFCLSGRTSQASHIARDCSQFLEEIKDYDNAIDMYTKTSQLYEMEKLYQEANKYNLKICELLIRQEKFSELERCAKIYEKVGKKSLQTHLVKSLAANYFYLSILCHIANDDKIGARKQMVNFSLEDPTFENQLQYTLLDDILSAIDSSSKDDFQQALNDYKKPMAIHEQALLVRVQETFFKEDNVNPLMPGQIPQEDEEPDFTGAGPQQEVAPQTDEPEFF